MTTKCTALHPEVPSCNGNFHATTLTPDVTCFRDSNFGAFLYTAQALLLCTTSQGITTANVHLLTDPRALTIFCVCSAMEILANVSAGNPWREKTLSFSPGKGLSSPRGEKSPSFSFSSVKLFPDPRKSNNLRLTSPRAALGSVEQPPSFYDLLGITEDVSLRDIKQAYRQLARKYHPDVCPPERSEEYTRRFIEVQEAYETLTDPRRKNLYDTHIGGLSSRGSGSNPWNCSQEELAKEEWRSRWEVQLCNLKQKKDFDDGEQQLSWGARMRQKIRNSSN